MRSKNVKREQDYIKVYKMMSYDAFVKCLQEKGLKSSLPYSSANPMENLPRCENEPDLASRIQKAKDYDSVLMSFTANHKSPTLWGLYGDAGAGVCLEFWFPKVVDENSIRWEGQEVARIQREGKRHTDYLKLSKMYYSEDELRKEWKDKKTSMKELMLYKSKEWSFEKEYRMVVPMNWASSCRDGILYFREPFRYLKTVYLGPLSPHSPSYLSSIIRLHLFAKNDVFKLNNNVRKIPVKRAQFDEMRFRIHLSKRHERDTKMEERSQLQTEDFVPFPMRKNEKMTLLYMYASEAALKKILDTWSLKASVTHAVNDPMECLPQKYDVSDPYARSTPEGKAVYLCFSKTMSSPSMWGNYADEGKGACLAFLFPLVDAGVKGMKLDPKISMSKKGQKELFWRDVVYNDVRVRKTSKQEIVRRKARDWSYEQEVRCFCEPMDADMANDGMLLYQLPMQFLAGVILGPRSQYATQYMQKKLALGLELHKHEVGNWVVDNNIMPWLLCSNACYHLTKYAFYAHPWFDNSSANRFFIAQKIAKSLNLLRFPLQFPWHEKQEIPIIKKQNINWGVCADLLNEISDDEAKELASLSDEKDFAERIVSRLDSMKTSEAAQNEATDVGSGGECSSS